MGDSLPPAAAIDLVDSFARRCASDVEIVLARPPAEWAAGTAQFGLTRGRQSVEARVVEATDARLVLRANRALLTDGRWSIHVDAAGATGGTGATGAAGATADTAADGPDRRSLDVRLLVQGDRPLVLLWGARTGSSMEPPAPPTRARQAAAAAGTLLDRALVALPPGPAQSVRGTMRRVARRVLP